LSLDALDNLVSRSGQTFLASPIILTTATATAPFQLCTATMGDKDAALQTTLDALAATLKSLQASVDANS
jgi:hypothetical protein